ncbi:hypothetical protein RIF29_22751 [Crotalaria pallida]|uniref:B-like cyclin n=1 Tax=Crotalaria pallida TaxID=3830 RepID=A0AAN9IAJ9_CROPI
MSSLSPDHSAAGSFFRGEVISDHLSPPATFSPQLDEEAITALIEAEAHHMPESDYLQRCRNRLVNMTARLDAVNWILKVHAFYHFRPVTAFLSINYLDRFLSCTPLPRERKWAFQLVSVACLSLAAKMEESEVPLLVELQRSEPRFVFEPKTVQRMELRIMSNLNWRLRSVTPFDYMHYFITNLPSSSSAQTDSVVMNRLLSTASDLIIATTRVIDFLEFGPSIMAAAAVLSSAGIVTGNTQSPFCFHQRLNNEMVRRCQQLMEEYVVDTCPYSCRRPQPVSPSSPVGVLDAVATCGSCDTPSDRNYPISAQAQTQAQAEPQTSPCDPLP